MRKLTLGALRSDLKNKRVVVIGSAPCGLLNNGKHIDSYDRVIRVNNFKIYGYEPQLGERLDYHYSFYGSSIRTKREELRKRKIKAHLCKCPDEECHVTEWHRKRGNRNGGDFRWIYKNRKNDSYWVAPVYVPQKDHYMQLFHMLQDHVPTTGFSCIWEVLESNPTNLYITGFDFFASKVHNINEQWLEGRPDDPVGHRPHLEKELLKKWIFQDKKPIILDNHLKRNL